MDFPLTSPGYALCEIQTVSVSASAGAHGKGAYVTLVASTAFDCDGLILTFSNPSPAAGHMLDIAVGAAASEVIIIANAYADQASVMPWSIWVPISIPAGSRIAARTQSTIGSNSTKVGTTLVRGSMWSQPSGGKIVTLGANIATTRGVTVDPGAVLNTFGAYATLDAATTEDLSGLQIVLGGRGNSNPTFRQMGEFIMEVAVGAAAAEQTIIRYPFSSYTDGKYGHVPQFFIPCFIPAGSRISVRGRSATTDAVDRLFEVVGYGLVI